MRRASACRVFLLAVLAFVAILVRYGIPADLAVIWTLALLMLFRHFDLPELDLIIPAVGDHRHPLINIGVISATSAAQQQDKPGALSETLACSGMAATVDDAARILHWQTMMGDSTGKVVSEGRKCSEQQRWPVFRNPVCLWQWCQNDIDFLHARYSGLGSRTIENVYSGSVSPYAFCSDSEEATIHCCFSPSA